MRSAVHHRCHRRRVGQGRHTPSAYCMYHVRRHSSVSSDGHLDKRVPTADRAKLHSTELAAWPTPRGLWRCGREAAYGALDLPILHHGMPSMQAVHTLCRHCRHCGTRPTPADSLPYLHVSHGDAVLSGSPEGLQRQKATPVSVTAQASASMLSHISMHMGHERGPPPDAMNPTRLIGLLNGPDPGKGEVEGKANGGRPR